MQIANLEIIDLVTGSKWFVDYVCKQITKAEIDDIFQLAIAEVKFSKRHFSGNMKLVVNIPFSIEKQENKNDLERN